MKEKHEYPQPQGLINVLLNAVAEYGDRSDAATDLAVYDEPEAEVALLSIARDPFDDPDIVQLCGESLGEIWSRKAQLDLERLRNINRTARVPAIAIIKARRPEWTDLLQLIVDDV